MHKHFISFMRFVLRLASVCLKWLQGCGFSYLSVWQRHSQHTEATITRNRKILFNINNIKVDLIHQFAPKIQAYFCTILQFFYSKHTVSTSFFKQFRSRVSRYSEYYSFFALFSIHHVPLKKFFAKSF